MPTYVVNVKYNSFIFIIIILPSRINQLINPSSNIDYDPDLG